MAVNYTLENERLEPKKIPIEKESSEPQNSQFWGSKR